MIKLYWDNQKYKFSNVQIALEQSEIRSWSDAVDCINDIFASPGCADPSWDLYNIGSIAGSGFCCGNGTIGAFNADSINAGVCVASVTAGLTAATLSTSGNCNIRASTVSLTTSNSAEAMTTTLSQAALTSSSSSSISSTVIETSTSLTATASSLKNEELLDTEQLLIELDELDGFGSSGTSSNVLPSTNSSSSMPISSLLSDDC
ncbi:hypothetical protein ACMFMG_009706 [Clarireedia jacksonii]